MELSCPCEESMKTLHHDKLHKYNSLCLKVKAKGWKVNYFAVEFDASGYCVESLCFCLKALDFKTKASKSVLEQISIATVQPCFFIWLSRDSRTWDKTLSVLYDIEILSFVISRHLDERKILLFVWLYTEINHFPSFVVWSTRVTRVTRVLLLSHWMHCPNLIPFLYLHLLRLFKLRPCQSYFCGWILPSRP